MEIKLSTQTPTSHVLTINCPDQELVADVLFSYGTPIGAIIFLGDGKGGTYTRALISMAYKAWAPKEPGPASYNHTQSFFNGYWPAAYVEPEVLYEIIIGRMPETQPTETLSHI